MPSGTGRWTERALPGGWAWRSLHWSGKHVSSLKVFKIKFFITVSYPNTTRLLTLFSPQDACVSSVILRPPQWQMTNLRFREPKVKQLVTDSWDENPLLSPLPILIPRLHLTLQRPEKPTTPGPWLIIQALTIPVAPNSLGPHSQFPQTFSLFPMALLHVWPNLKEEFMLR